MRAPAPVALGCVSLVLCLLELPHGLARTRTRRDPPASLPWEHPGKEPPGTLRHSPKLTPHHRPRHGARLAPRHRLLMPKLSPQHGARLAPRHRLLIPKLSPQHGAQLAPRHRLLIPKLSHRHGARLAPRHRLLMPKLSPQHDARLAPRGGRRLMLEHGARGRRHAGHLMRVGCVLGTCQVQNLSHRLWQLMGQSGRRDSSPMNPNSPHSYG